ncbi:hypothetical protein FB554_2090 [Barrientosiimonas humi]|uniref:Uncharacterized protein n=2 Tax=Barrientosiimonas TaxID=1535207 RepID=A0A542XDQ7_9MICO|nr:MULTISPECIES: hypothetical protein [Barrientosiimonas]TQL33934.1 hypothetical protein FB554_2090 [Barrientosiimonas humi]BDZ58894.1 hypothetical protein GCM10025872_25510 [Barrientosiimonas endolithica]CAG7573924.1 hypothetical protein BH39T_PBIAJDOK_02566 [Barrientosiimonas humi]
MLVGQGFRDTHPRLPRSYLADGRVVAWDVTPPPGWSVAVDAELEGQQLSDLVRRRAGLPVGTGQAQTLVAWTQAEVMAKLLDVPILLRLKEFGLGLADLGEHEPVALHSWAMHGLILTVGVHAPPRSAATPER